MAKLTVDELLVRIDADTKGLRADLRRVERLSKRTGNTMSRQFDRADKSAGRLSKTIKGLGALYAIQLGTRMTKAGLDFAGSVEEMSNKSKVVFAETLPKVRAEIVAFADDVGRSQFALEGMAASLQDTFVPLGFARDEASKLSVSLTKLAVDVGSFQNKADADVMRDFQSALVGNHETVKKYGIIIGESTIAQEAWNSGINKSYSELTEQEKVQIRTNLLFKGSKDAIGDAERTQDSYTNSKKKLIAQTEKLINVGFKPFLDDAGNSVSKLADAVGWLADAMGRVNDEASKHNKDYDITDNAALRHRLEGTLEEDASARIWSGGRRQLDVGGYNFEATARERDRIRAQINENNISARRMFQAGGSIGAGVETLQGGDSNVSALPKFGADNYYGALDAFGGDGREIIDLQPVEEAKTAIGELKQTIFEATSANEDFTTSFEDLSKSMSESLSEALVQGDNILDSIASSFSDFIDKMIAKYLEAEVLGPLISGFLGGGGGPHSYGVGADVPLEAFGGAGGPIRAYAGGGDFHKGDLISVGENGREIIAAGMNGKVISNQQMKGMGGETIVNNFTFTINTEDPNADARVRQALAQAEPVIIAKIEDKTRRSGSFANRVGT